MLCAMTGSLHGLFWMRSAWWCQNCRQKVELCCEGGGSDGGRGSATVGDQGGCHRVALLARRILALTGIGDFGYSRGERPNPAYRRISTAIRDFA